MAPAPLPRFGAVLRALRVIGTLCPLLLGTCPSALVVAGGVHLWRALLSPVCLPHFVWSSRSRCSNWLTCRCGAFLHPGGCRSQIYWAAARGTWRPAENQAHCVCRWPLRRQGRWACCVSYPFGAPQWACPWQVPPASVLDSVRCDEVACLDPLTDASGFTVPSVFRWGTQPVHRGCFVWTPKTPLSGRRTARPCPARVILCVLFLAGSGRRASRARFRALHLSFGRFALLLCWAPFRVWLPLLGVCLAADSVSLQGPEPSLLGS